MDFATGIFRRAFGGRAGRRMLAAVLATAVVGGGCQSAYYHSMEKVGVHKRDILVDRVEGARDSQSEAKEQFADALEEFQSVAGFSGGDLEKKYKTLKAELDRCESASEEVRDRIDKVEHVSQALFKEWRGELKAYSNAKLRDISAKKLSATEDRYESLIGAMRRAESKIDPVLRVFRDQVLFLKHNLNAQAIAALQSELTGIETNVAGLIREMEASIAEANQFIDTLEAGE